MSEVENYLEQVASFKEVSPERARQLLEQKENGILYIGRETCPFCRRFVAKLSHVAVEHQLTVHYLHSQSPVYDAQAIQDLRADYNVPTVPGFLVSTASGVKVKCDSSMSEEEIFAFATGA